MLGRFACAVTFLMLCSPIVAEQQPQTQYFTPILGSGQFIRGPAAAHEGAFGTDAKKSADGFNITAVSPGSPAEKAGLRVGDIIEKIDEEDITNLSQMEFYGRLNKKPGESIHVNLKRGNQESATEMTAEPRGKVYPDEAKQTSSISELIADGHASISVILAQETTNPQRIGMWLMISNFDVPTLALNDGKFFVLDGQRHQLHQVTLDEITYSIQTAVAQNMHAGQYIPPPPPSRRQYTISGSESGNYTLNDLGGGMRTMSGTSSSTYTVTPQPDYGQLGYSLGLAIRQMRDRKHDKKLVEQAQKTLTQWNSTYLKLDTPIISGENRTGLITYWSPQEIKGPFRVILFVNDPITNKEQDLTFDFQ